MFYVRGILILVLIILMFTGSTVFAKQKVPSETALFQIDPVKHKIIALKDNIVPSLVLNYISVTTDQPLYWPDEEVFLKVICPVRPLQKIAITLQKKDATPRNVGSLSLNEAGILVEKILDGKEKRIEAGEYRVEVRSEDKTIESFTTFTVVEGALGAVSFAYDFQEVTSPEGLKTAKGAWFLGNAAGVGMRWGNGLNVKNEVRVFNEPYSGVATVKSRCYLPGCNGIEAGAPVETDIANGLLETVLDVGGHSGPFEIEVITDQGNVRYLFGRSGHVERQSIPVSSGVTNYFSATLAPYEGSVSVSGRGIYITKDPTRQDDPMELDSVVVGENRQVALQVRKTILHPRLYLLSPDPQGNFSAEEVKILDVLEKGKEVILECSAPYVVMALGGFLEDENRMYEGWAMLFSETSLEVELAVPEEINPLQKSEVEITTTDRFSKKPVSVYGILEVFDNRVTSKSPKEPLISALGDSYRNLSNYLVSWQDRTGIGEKDKMESFVDEVKSLSIMESAPLPAAHGKGALALMMDKGGAPEGMPEGIESSGSLAQETIREGEKKVVYCGVIQTDEKGKARVLVSFPPQTGRCNARFVAVAGFDYQEQIKTIDVQKKNYLETSIPALLMPGATLYPQVHVVNTGEENLQLKITGAGVKGPVLIPVEPGSHDVQWEVSGQNYGTISLQLLGVNGKIWDQRNIEIRNIGLMPVTFSDVIISDGNPFTVEKDRKTAVYNGPAQLLQGMVTTIETNMYSWFGHSEAISASCAIRALLLLSIDKNLIGDEGMRESLATELSKGVKDLLEAFFDSSTNLIAPYPGLSGNILWSIWVSRNLSVLIDALDRSEVLKNEFADTVVKSQYLIQQIHSELKKRNISEKEIGFYDPEKGGQDVIPVEIDGKVVYRAVTDDAVVQWFVDKVWPTLDISDHISSKDLNARFIVAYDTYRFLRAFERSGVYYYLLLNARALFLQDNPHFFEVFRTIARGMILTQDPGMIQGPALLGGVYSAPNTMVKFLELLITMVEKKAIASQPVLLVEKANGEKSTLTLADDQPLLLETKEGPTTLTAPRYVTYRVDFLKNLNLFDYMAEKPFFQVSFDQIVYRMGEEGVFTIELDPDKDPSEYYVLVAIPSVLSLRQTGDLLSDYKGQLLYGQKVSGGERIQFVAVPFRGSRKMILPVEAAYRGASEGYVLIRHIDNPDLIQTVKIPKITVK